ncbi:hypothetical protein INR49_010284 [Caranx melampygus]|nr:hypothetical protein INR49_010284 [Caranx melampygus]
MNLLIWGHVSSRRTHLGHTYCPADLQFPSWPVGAVEGGPCESSGRSARRLQRQQCDCFLLYMSAVSGEQVSPAGLYVSLTPSTCSLARARTADGPA